MLKKNSLPLDIGLVDECPEDVKFAQLLSIQAGVAYIFRKKIFPSSFPHNNSNDGKIYK